LPLCTLNRNLHVFLLKDHSGAGIGGLTLSAALGLLGKDRALEVNVYESASEISAIGAGITFWPRQWWIMKTLGVDESLLKFTPNVPEDLVCTLSVVAISAQILRYIP
jgi:hypothetical protein